MAQLLCALTLLAAPACGGGTNGNGNGGDGGNVSHRNPDQTPGFGTPLHIGLGNFDRVLSTSDDGRWALATDESTPSNVALYLVDTTEQVSETSGPILLGDKPDPQGHSWVTHDGKYIIYTLNASATADLYISTTPAGKAVFTETGIDLGSLLLSNDQQWVAYTKGGALRVIKVGATSAKTVSSSAAYLPAFSPASKYLAWVGSATPLSLYDLSAGTTSQVGSEIDVFAITPDDSTVVGRFGSDLVTVPTTGPGSTMSGTIIAHNCANFWLSRSGKNVLFQQADSTGTMITLSVVPEAGGTPIAVGPTQTGVSTPLAVGTFTPDESGVVTFVPSPASSDGSIGALYVASATAGSPTMVQPAVGSDYAIGAKGDLLFRGDYATTATTDRQPAPVYLMHVNPASAPMKVGDNAGPAGVFQTVNGFSVSNGAVFTPDGTDFLFVGGANADLYSTQGTLGPTVMRDMACASPPCASQYYAGYPADGSYIFYFATPQIGGTPGFLTLVGRHHGTPMTVAGGARSVYAATPHGDVLLYAVHSPDRAVGGLWRVNVNP